MASKKATFIGSSKNLDPELKFIQESGFSKMEIDELKDQLKKIEGLKGGISINKYELFDILKGDFFFTFFRFLLFFKQLTFFS